MYGFRFNVSGFGFRVSGCRFRDRVSGFWFRLSGFGFRVSGFGFRASGFGFRVRLSGFGVRVSARRLLLCERLRVSSLLLLASSRGNLLRPASRSPGVFCTFSGLRRVGGSEGGFGVRGNGGVEVAPGLADRDFDGHWDLCFGGFGLRVGAVEV